MDRFLHLLVRTTFIAPLNAVLHTQDSKEKEEIGHDNIYSTGDTRLGAFLSLSQSCVAAANKRAMEIETATGLKVSNVKSVLHTSGFGGPSRVDDLRKICFPNRLNICE